MFGLGGSELFFIALAALLLLGPRHLPQFARGAARAYRELTRVRRHVDDTLIELRGELDLELDSKDDRHSGLSHKSGERRVPLDQLHAVDDRTAGGTPAPPVPEPPLAIPPEDDYLAR